MNYTGIDFIKNKISPIKTELINHKVFESIITLDDMSTFMEYHIFAVWDFMSLLKSLQIHLTSTCIPWFPKGDGEVRYLINEIVVGEESDLDYYGIRKSHFEIYLDAMDQIGASTKKIHNFIDELKKTGCLEKSIEKNDLPFHVSEFLKHTFDVIKTGKPHLIAAAFTYGREDLIPEMFLTMVDEFKKQFPDKISLLNYYLERHIELDGDHHSKLSENMMIILCGENKLMWDEAYEISKITLEKRINLWNAVYENISENSKTIV